MNKVTFEFDMNEKNGMNVKRFETLEFIALTKDELLLDFFYAFAIDERKENGIRRKRTRNEREQHAKFYGLESYKDVIE